MTSFWKKLNTLVQAQINDLVDRDRDDQTSRARRKYLARHDVSRNLQNDVKALRERINEALEYETQLQARVNQLYADISNWDAKSDQAIAENREDDARFALARLQQAQRDLAMAESDLREHRMLTQELISQVNTLDSVVSEAQHTEASEVTPSETSVPATSEDTSLVDDIARRVDNTRQKLGQLVQDTLETLSGEPRPEEPQQVIIEEEPEPPRRTTHPVNMRAVDDDLERRRSRLSKPPAPGEKTSDDAPSSD